VAISGFFSEFSNKYIGASKGVSRKKTFVSVSPNVILKSYVKIKTTFFSRRGQGVNGSKQA